MTEQTDTLAALQALLAQQQASTSPGAWSKPATGQTEVEGVSVPISLETPAGKIRLYLNFPGSCATSPSALMALIEQLHAAGMPLDIWQKQESSGGWNGNRNGNGGGWSNNNGGGGYGNRGGYGKRW
jgi:hypothetical protein